MIYFLVPVYNESPNIAGLAAGLINVLPGKDKHIVFVNDGSTDDTSEKIEQYFLGSPYTLLVNQINSGPGFSFNVGFSHIIEVSKRENDLVVSIEGDNTSDLSILPLMMSLAETWNFDLVLASVYAQGGGFSKTSFLRKLISITANQIFRTVFDVKVLTLSSFYRVYKVDLLKKIGQRHPSIVSEKGFLCALELLLKAIGVGARVIEVPMMLKSENRKGKSKMKIVKTSLRYVAFLIRHLFSLKA
jgi:dolichol-phosphate mannosyltransferase